MRPDGRRKHTLFRRFLTRVCAGRGGSGGVVVGGHRDPGSAELVGGAGFRRSAPHRPGKGAARAERGAVRPGGDRRGSAGRQTRTAAPARADRGGGPLGRLPSPGGPEVRGDRGGAPAGALPAGSGAGRPARGRSPGGRRRPGGLFQLGLRSHAGPGDRPGWPGGGASGPGAGGEGPPERRTVRGDHDPQLSAADPGGESLHHRPGREGAGDLCSCWISPRPGGSRPCGATSWPTPPTN